MNFFRRFFKPRTVAAPNRIGIIVNNKMVLNTTVPATAVHKVIVRVERTQVLLDADGLGPLPVKLKAGDVTTIVMGMGQ